MPYAGASRVAAYCRNLLGSASEFDTSTCPTAAQVGSWLSSGCAVLETHLGGRGYDVPVASTARAYEWLAELDALWAAAHAEFHRTNVTLSPGERTRGQVFYSYFWDELDRLSRLDLSRVGDIGRSSTGKIYVGGVSVAEKQIIEADSDLLKPRFFRGLGRNKEIVEPTPSTACA